MKMTMQSISVPEILDRLESIHGPQEPCWPVDPYEFLVWWHCGYPASDAACARGWDALKKSIGTEPGQILAASEARLAAAMKASGMVPEVRALRLKEIAQRVQNEFGGDLRVALAGPVAGVRRMLKKFPGIADPGADRILLFGRIVPVAAVPSNCPHVLVRIRCGPESQDYGATYRMAQKLISQEVTDQFHTRTRAYLLLKQHGQTLCKRSRPACGNCPLRDQCSSFASFARQAATASN
jgi:endonuclease III